VLLDAVISAGPMPALELTMQFAARRQAVLAHNIANIDTPNFLPIDVSVPAFQRTLAQAIDARRAAGGGMHGPLDWKPTRELAQEPDGRLRLVPRTPSPGILFHDRNNRDVERLMQDLAENVGVFRLATDLMRHHASRVRDALAERV
jgi:flagellar basal-body rod protein FlgB